MKANGSTQIERKRMARHMLVLLLFIPLFNCVAAAAMGCLVVYSDADEYKFLAGFLSAANVGGWLWWVSASWKQMRFLIKKWLPTKHTTYPGFRLATLMSLSLAVGWVGVLFLLAYGMLG